MQDVESSIIHLDIIDKRGNSVMIIIGIIFILICIISLITTFSIMQVVGRADRMEEKMK